jgi:hypothetical protein
MTWELMEVNGLLRFFAGGCGIAHILFLSKTRSPDRAMAGEIGEVQAHQNVG